nr:acylcarnitine hydrolase-like [Ciona intestinalis]|eukprot:XP_009857808.1 acylcarnitine hydrolase-like [Ciona intestinalis]
MNHLALLCILIHLVGVNCYRDPITNAFVTLIQQLDDEMKNQESYDELGLVQRRQHTQPIYPETYEEKQPDLSYAPISDTFPQVKVGNKLIIGSTLAESHAFYSIPYAKPPTGDLRFMPPVAIDNLTETLNASLPDFRMCYQIKNCDDGDCNEFLMTEDCLVLNINVPSSIDLSDPEREPEGDKIPVMFYIHGGFFFEGRGTTPKTDGRWLSEAAKSIVVTINYRVGPLGFLLFEENGQLIEGNQGFKDQQLALKWVYENIGKFGGDSQRIMIFGESSGAQSVEYHLLARNSESYFLSAITESNPAVFPFQTVEKSLGVTDRVLEVINCTDIACLR